MSRRGFGSEVHVTPHFSLKFETKPKKRTAVTLPGVFCDWVSLYQSHPYQLPVLADGAVIRVDADGKQESVTLRTQKIGGSFESSVFVRCDGSTVHFQGNVSKFGRPDNVFGLGWQDCISRINAIVQSLGLPPFTAGVRGEVVTPQGHKPHWSGARVTRLDLTQNFATGSADDAHHFMRFLAGQQASRLKTGTHGEGETVDFGRGSRRVYSKAYLKAPELRRHAVSDIDQELPNDYLNNLADWCDSVGLVRFETTYKSTFLIDTNNQFLGNISMQYLLNDFENRKSVFTRANLEIDQLADLEPKLLSVYRMWQAGDPIKCSRATFYRHRARLLPYGVDIAVKSNVVPFPVRTRVIQLGAVNPPDFYKLPYFSPLRLVA